MSLRVLFVAPPVAGPSGWSTAATGIVRSLTRTGRVDARVVVAGEDRERARELFADARVLTLPAIQEAGLAKIRLWPRSAVSWARARWLVDAGPLDLVHSLEAYPVGWIGHLLARRHRARHVVTAVGTYSVRWSRANPLDRRLYLRTLRGAACLCPISRATLDRMRAGLGGNFPDLPVSVNLLGTEAPADAPRIGAVDRQGRAVLLTVGAVKRRKGQDTAIRAFLRLRSDFPDAEYRIVGPTADPGFERQLRRELADRGGTGVRFLGRLSDAELRRQYAEATVFVLTPRDVGEKFEGFGLVYLEAGHFGLPVVATRAGGVEEAVIDGETGLLAAADDVDQIERQLRRLLSDPALARRLGEANRRRAKELSWERYAREQLRIYDACRDRRGPGRA